MKRNQLTGRKGWQWPLTAVAAAVAGGVLVETAPIPLFPQALAEDKLEAPASPSVPMSFADVVERASPAVVNIQVTKVARSEPAVGYRNFPPGSPLDEFFGRFFDLPDGQYAPQPRRMQGAGSGFVIDSSGYIATNNHVVSDSDDIVVTFTDGTQLDAKVIGQDPKTDVALIKVDADKPLPFVKFADSDQARVGEWVLAIGNPFGLGGTATAGIISARGRDIQSGPYDDYLQIDAPINSGNSGGPVFNAAGDVIGINTAIFSPNGGNIGIGFAVPANQAASVIAQLKDGGSVERGWLGVQIQDVDADLAATLGLEGEHGALVADVVEGSPAAAAGLEAGDVITQFGHSAIDSARTLSRTVAGYKPGASAEIEVVRDGKTRKLDVKLGDSAATEQVAALTHGGAADSGLGLTLAPLTDERRAQLGLDQDVEGVVVMDVRADSAAAEKGIRPGDVITEVDHRQVSSVESLVSALNAAKQDGKNALLLVRSGEGQRFVAISAS